ncbi:hypothetical protein EJB05_47818, partial [Eragrostis curvula]
MGDSTSPGAAAALVSVMMKKTNLFMQIVVNKDGTVTCPQVPALPPSADSPASPVLSRDVPLDAARGTFLHLYLPNPVPPSPAAKLPVILYFHGGGFVVLSAASIFYHNYCDTMAAAVPALAASLEYRLAPEHRLPAAYEDAEAAVAWLRDAAPEDPWVAAHGDLCFVMGSSSGGNMAFFAGVRAKKQQGAGGDLVRGLLLHQPYLGGVERTPSEANSEDDGMLPLEANDLLWRLALPEGAERDHEFCNPAKSLPHDVVAGLPRCLVTGNAADPLIDRQREFVGWLKDRGVDVVAKADSPGYHAGELFVPKKAQELCAAVREFVFASSTILTRL